MSTLDRRTKGLLEDVGRGRCDQRIRSTRCSARRHQRRARAVGADRLRQPHVAAFEGHGESSPKQGLQLEIVAISEVFDRFELETQDAVEKMTGSRPKAHRDYRDLLALDTVDCVVIASPDHWHARHTLDALKAGKHV